MPTTPTGPTAFSAVTAPRDRNDQIRQVGRELEGVFLREVLRVMRDSVPESSLLQSGLAGDIYGDMLDDELASRAGSTGGLGLADIIARQLGADVSPAHALAGYRQAAAGRWVHPLPDGPVLPRSPGGRFGVPRPGGAAPRLHMGVDLAAPSGTPVHAASDGVVERVERSPDEGGRAGRYVRIAHTGGIVTRYIHLADIRGDLSPGDRVSAGEIIGTVGRTGVHRSGPHLHFTVSRREGGPGTTESYIDPESWLRAWRQGFPADPAKVGLASDEGGAMGGLP
jgi:murein DD-endopeptidase MepM/ murein hydrolase activator NlpD